MLSEFNAFTLADFPVSLLFKLPESASNLKMVSFYNMSAFHGVGLARGREYGVSACITLPRKNTVVSVKGEHAQFRISTMQNHLCSDSSLGECVGNKSLYKHKLPVYVLRIHAKAELID